MCGYSSLFSQILAPPLLTFTAPSHLSVSLMMCAYLPSFVIIDPLLFSVYASSLLPLSCDNRQAVFVPISFSFFFSPADSLWFICPSSEPPEGHQDQAQKTQASRHLFLLSLQSFSLLSSLTSVSFFPSLLLPVIFPCLNYRSCSGRSPSPPSLHSSSVPSFHPFICLPFFSSCCQLPVLVSVVSAISFVLFQHLHSSSIRII